MKLGVIFPQTEMGTDAGIIRHFAHTLVKDLLRNA